MRLTFLFKNTEIVVIKNLKKISKSLSRVRSITFEYFLKLHWEIHEKLKIFRVTIKTPDWLQNYRALKGFTVAVMFTDGKFRLDEDSVGCRCFGTAPLCN